MRWGVGERARGLGAAMAVLGTLALAVELVCRAAIALAGGL